MAYRCEKECRALHSEPYLISEAEMAFGRIDLHFTGSIADGAPSIAENLTEAIDEELVMSANLTVRALS